MEKLTERVIRASFVNCTKGEAKRMDVPKDLDTRPWDDLDFFGWRDPSARDRAYLVTEEGVGVALRVARTGQLRSGMCSLCMTTHTGDGVALMTARKAGKNGQQGNSVGAYICADLACSLHLRGRTDVRRMKESLTLGEQIDRTMTNLRAFLDKVVS
jgi:treble-clef zinc-finger protein